NELLTPSANPVEVLDAEPTHHPRTDMVRLDAEVKQITHAIRMAACNAETTLARALNGRYARASDEAYALIREALTTPRRTQALAALCDQLNQAASRYPGTDLVLRYEVKPHPGIA
ncbi:MAG TPA: hypothetical protein VG123_38840, partial [Streptosporangiaceae bacterium]|nr:hypothetical protein [Streptosporangiaceae bacterium]